MRASTGSDTPKPRPGGVFRMCALPVCALAALRSRRSCCRGRPDKAWDYVLGGTFCLMRLCCSRSGAPGPPGYGFGLGACRSIPYARLAIVFSYGLAPEGAVAGFIRIGYKAPFSAGCFVPCVSRGLRPGSPSRHGLEARLGCLFVWAVMENPRVSIKFPGP